MTRSRVLFFLASLALLVPIVTTTLMGAVSSRDDGEDSLYKYLSVFSEVLSLVRRAYVEETSIEALFAGAMDGTTDALDAMATYVPATAAHAFRESLEIGAGRSGLTIVKERGIAYVLAAGTGSPAEAAKLRTGDIVTKLDGASTRAMPLWKISALFAGQPGTRVRVDYLRRGRALETTVELAEYRPPSPRLERPDGVPLIRLPRLDAGAGEVMRGLLGELAAGGEDRLVLDLRGSAGGEAAAAYGIGDLLVQGRLGELRGKGEVIESFDGPAEPVWRGRLVVLTDRGTQGSSEILAAVLSQAASADLVGERTFGHAGRHALVDLSSGALVYLTDAFYTGPDGEAIDEGLVPDVKVNEASRSFAESDVPVGDLILKRGLEILQGEAAGKKAA